MEQQRERHEYNVRMHHLLQRIYADYIAYIAEQESFLLHHRNNPHELKDMFPCEETDIVRTYKQYQQRRNAFLKSSALRSETHAFQNIEEWLTLSETFHYTFDLYRWIRNHELVTIRHFVNAHSIFVLPMS